MARVRDALAAAGIDEVSYCGHSFRIGAATTRGVEDSVIKTLGRWESTAYIQYVRIPREQLTGYFRVLGRRDRTCVGFCLSNYVYYYDRVLFSGLCGGEA